MGFDIREVIQAAKLLSTPSIYMSVCASRHTGNRFQIGNYFKKNSFSKCPTQLKVLPISVVKNIDISIRIDAEITETIPILQYFQILYILTLSSLQQQVDIHTSSH